MTRRGGFSRGNEKKTCNAKQNPYSSRMSNTDHDFISAEELLNIINHMNTVVTEDDFTAEDDEEIWNGIAGTTPIEEALGYSYDNRVQGTIQYA
jgi:hypothetical protein